MTPGTQIRSNITQKVFFESLREKWDNSIRKTGQNPYGADTPASITLDVFKNDSITIWRPLPISPNTKLSDFGVDPKDSITVSYTDMAAGIIRFLTADQSKGLSIIEEHSLHTMEGIKPEIEFDPQELLEAIHCAKIREKSH